MANNILDEMATAKYLVQRHGVKGAELFVQNMQQNACEHGLDSAAAWAACVLNYVKLH